jgi:7-cyano-7-deazaguanine synthase
MPKHVVLVSGGLDSAVVLHLACWRDGPDEVIACGIAYGQRHINELSHGRELAKQLGVSYFQATVDPSPWKLMPLIRGTTQTGRTVYAMATGGVSDAFLPGRNVAFLSMALAVAGLQDATHIWMGANKDDAVGFPDCRGPFRWAWQQMASQALGRGIHLEAPLIELSKREVVGLARQLHVDIDATWSCYRPQYKVQGIVACGVCDACVLRADALVDDARRS